MPPEQIDVLLTHTPPFSIFDQDRMEDRIGIGSKSLLKIIVERKPLLHCFGHIHFPGGHTRRFSSEELQQQQQQQQQKENIESKPESFELKAGHTLFVNDALSMND